MTVSRPLTPAAMEAATEPFPVLPSQTSAEPVPVAGVRLGSRTNARRAVEHYLHVEVYMSSAMGHAVMPAQDREWVARRAAILLQSASRVREVVPMAKWEDGACAPGWCWGACGLLEGCR